jgi:hypothetical protein
MKSWVSLFALGAAALGLIGLCQADTKTDAPPGEVKSTKLVIKDMT